MDDSRLVAQFHPLDCDAAGSQAGYWLKKKARVRQHRQRRLTSSHPWQLQSEPGYQGP
eukprot:COSAG02_NODE_65587_length_257_cov_1.468354_1_plen_57_part_01